MIFGKIYQFVIVTVDVDVFVLLNWNLWLNKTKEFSGWHLRGNRAKEIWSTNSISKYSNLTNPPFFWLNTQYFNILRAAMRTGALTFIIYKLINFWKQTFLPRKKTVGKFPPWCFTYENVAVWILKCAVAFQVKRLGRSTLNSLKVSTEILQLDRIPHYRTGTQFHIAKTHDFGVFCFDRFQYLPFTRHIRGEVKSFGEKCAK